MNQEKQWNLYSTSERANEQANTIKCENNQREGR